MKDCNAVWFSSSVMHNLSLVVITFLSLKMSSSQQCRYTVSLQEINYDVVHVYNNACTCYSKECPILSLNCSLVHAWS